MLNKITEFKGTATIRELIEWLLQCDMDAMVLMNGDNLDSVRFFEKVMVVMPSPDTIRLAEPEEVDKGNCFEVVEIC